jgi:nucleotide-binding universal stress UspA family protein
VSKPILVGYDPRGRDRAAVDFGILISRLTGAPLVVVAVETGAPLLPVSAGQSLPYAVTTVDPDLVENGSQALDELAAELRAAGLEVRCNRVRSTSAARGLHAAAEHEEAGLLVVGSSRRAGAKRVLAGPTAETAIHGAPCPVALVPRDWSAPEALKTIGVGFVESEEGREALRSAHALARRAGATLRVFTVLKERLGILLGAEHPTEGRFGKSVEDVEGEYLARAEREARLEVAMLGDDVPVQVDGFVGDPADVLIELSEHVDALVLGSRNFGPVRAVLLGSVSRRVAAGASCPVLVVPRGVGRALESLMVAAAA